MEAGVLASYFSSYIRVIDIILAAFIVWGAYKGYKRGFLLELISIFLFITGIVLIFYLLSLLFSTTEEHVAHVPKSTAFIIYTLSFLIGSFLLNQIGRRLQEKIDYSVLDDFDNFAAMLTGGLKYAVFLSIFIGLLDAVGLKLPPEVTGDSYLYPKLLGFKNWMVDVGGTVAPSVKEMARQIEHFLKN